MAFCAYGVICSMLPGPVPTINSLPCSGDSPDSTTSLRKVRKSGTVPFVSATATVTLPILCFGTSKVSEPVARSAEGSATALAPVALNAASDFVIPGTVFNSSGVKVLMSRSHLPANSTSPGSFPFLSIVARECIAENARLFSSSVFLIEASISSAEVALLHPIPTIRFLGLM